MKAIIQAYSPKEVERIARGEREGGGSAVAYAWFVWQKGYAGSTEVRWI